MSKQLITVKWNEYEMNNINYYFSKEEYMSLRYFFLQVFYFIFFFF